MEKELITVLWKPRGLLFADSYAASAAGKDSRTTSGSRFLVNATKAMAQTNALLMAIIFIAVNCAFAQGNNELSSQVQTASLTIQAPELSPSGCRGLVSPPPLAIIKWNLSSSGIRSRQDINSAAASIQNNTKEDIEIILSANYYLDGFQAKEQILTLVLAPEETRSVEIDLRSSKNKKVEDLKYSGEAVLKAIARTSSENIGTIVSEGLFFHKEGKDLIVYDENALINTFQGGDYRRVGIATKASEETGVDKETDEGIAVVRMKGGPVLSSDEVRQILTKDGSLNTDHAE